MITFERVVKENIYIAEEMIHSNSPFCEREYGDLSETGNELESLSSKTEHYLIKVEDTYIGLTSYREQPEEKLVWIDLLMIHADYQGYGYGTTAYYELEDTFKKRDLKLIRIKVGSDNKRVKQFWKRNGFFFMGMTMNEGVEETSYEKHLEYQ